MAAAITFWLAWFLMPDPGTTDARHIFEIVNQIRPMVFSSVVFQIISSVLYRIVLFLLATIGRPRRKTIIGLILWAIGTMGMCADAFFHLLAWYMTDASVTINEDVIRVMDFMQTGGVNFLIPLMLPFFIGGPMAAWGFLQTRYYFKKTCFAFHQRIHCRTCRYAGSKSFIPERNKSFTVAACPICGLADFNRV